MRLWLTITIDFNGQTQKTKLPNSRPVTKSRVEIKIIDIILGVEHYKCHLGLRRSHRRSKKVFRNIICK